MGRTKDQYIEYLNTLDYDDPQNREIRGRVPDKNKPTERDSNVTNDTLRCRDEGRGIPRKSRRSREQD